MPRIPTFRRRTPPVRRVRVPRFETVYGVDFSGARLAGRATWVATLRVPDETGGRLALTDLRPLGKIVGAWERGPALAGLREMIAASRRSLWAMDFPFGLPVELFPPRTAWPRQLADLGRWPGEAYAYGLDCIRRARLRGDAMHIRRATDVETKTPFDCYHYRIVYQMFHGMRDVLAPLAGTPGTAILPFDYGALAGARRVLIEVCPASVLKRRGWPHQNYKQPGGRTPDALRRKTRRAILAGLEPFVEISAWRRKVLMCDGGGDALDAVIAGVGGRLAMSAADHAAIAAHPRYRREGCVLA